MTFWLIVLWAAGAVVLLCGLVLVVVVSVQAARNRRMWRDECGSCRTVPGEYGCICGDLNDQAARYLP